MVAKRNEDVVSVLLVLRRLEGLCSVDGDEHRYRPDPLVSLAGVLPATCDAVRSTQTL